MPLPLGIAGIGGVRSVIGGISKLAGVPQARLRSRKANKRLRMQALEEAVADARKGGERGKEAYRVIAQWAGLLANGTVPMAWPQRYSGDQGNGAWPGGDGSRQAALEQATLLATIGAQEPTRAAPKGNGTTGSSGRSTRTRGAAKERTYVRYNPDTGERVLVTRDDPRFDEWPNRKRAAPRARATSSTRRTTTRRRKSAAQRETDAAIRRITTQATNAGLRLTAAGVRKFASMAAAAGMSAGAAAALVVSTGLAAYFATKWVIGKIEQSNDRAYQREQLALAYRKARLRWAEQEGRPLTRDEQKFLGENFKQALAAFDAGVTYTPPT